MPPDVDSKYRFAQFSARLIDALIFTLCLLIAAIAIAPRTAHADDKVLARLHAILVPLRPVVPPGDHSMGPAPSHTTDDFNLDRKASTLVAAKNGLRDWIESRLASFGKDGDEKALEARLNAQLHQADLLCADPSDGSKDPCVATGEENGSGYFYPVLIGRQESGPVLVVRTRAGILCGTDDSAYAYQWDNGKWRRIWQDSQTVQANTRYEQLSIDDVEVSSPDQKTGERLALALGSYWGCVSMWHDVSFRLWRVRPNGRENTLLLDERAYAYLGAHDPPIIGSVSDDEAIIEYSAASLDPGFSFDGIRHYQVDGDKVTRVDPIALSPPTFAQEWLDNEWTESSAWTDPHSASALQSVHDKLRAGPKGDGYHGGEYIDAARHCRENVDLWQVGINFGDDDSPAYKSWFFVRWRPPYRFQMVDVTNTPRADCDERDDVANDWGVPFPIQGWR